MVKKLTFLLLFFIPITSYSQLSFNFESGSLTGWTQVPDGHWAASSSASLNGTYSLKQTLNSSVDATDRISTALPPWNPNSGTITWQAKIRHGYNPSSSNRWWIYLMANQDANQMQLGGLASGYAIGVNLVGSDDLLKLWRIDNGVAQPIIASTLNWETQVKTAGIGAVEIERKPNGIFTLKASSIGSFSGLTNFGSITDNGLSDFSFFGICYSYSSSGDLLLWVDDISISFNPVNKNDITTEVINPTAQISANSISSISNSRSLALDLMKFQVKDKIVVDNLPTRVKKLVFKKAISSNSANWLATIGGIRIKNPDGEVSILNQIIKDDRIEVAVDSTTSVIPNGETKEFTLSLFLKPENLVEGSTIKMMIDSVHHGFEAGLSGSDFTYTFPHRVLSNVFTVGVNATSLKFLQTPKFVTKNFPFTVSVVGSDSNGNTDTDFVGLITLALFDGVGILSSSTNLAKNANQGVATWTDLIYSTRGKFRIKANSAGFQQVESDEISVLNDTTSTINPPTSQPNGVAISSLANYPAKAFEVLRFSIYDLGNTDGVPTIVRNIKLSRIETPDAASLSKTIEGILMVVDGNPISISQPDIKTSYLTFTAENLTVPDGEYKDVNIFIYLKNQGLTDNQKIQLKVDAVNHGCSANPMGSTFKVTFPQPIVSNIFWVDVFATQLKFTVCPIRVGVKQPFCVGLNTVDLNGNVDKDYSGGIILSLHSGLGELDNPLGSSKTISSGICTYSDLSYNIPGQFSLLASSTNLNSISSASITCGDADGDISPLSIPQNPIVVSSTSTQAGSAVEVFKISVFDGGTTDGLPLVVSKIGLHCFDLLKADLLNKQIGGFVVKKNNEIINVESYSLSGGKFDITLKSGDLVIPDGDTIALSVSIFLQKGVVIDNFTFQFYAPTANHGWESISTGTGFATNFTSSVYGPECKIGVEATKLRFVDSPFAVAPQQDFTLKVSAVDAYENIDYDYSDQIGLSLDYGNGSFSSASPSKSLSSGYALWDDVKLVKTGTYRFKANSYHLGTAVSDNINCGLVRNCLVNEDFEASLDQNWSGDDWAITSISPINGSKSLQHKPNTNEGLSMLSIPVEFLSMGDKFIEWNFTLKNGGWSSSSENYFYFALMANTKDLQSDTLTGFFVGINPSLGNNSVSLWRVGKGVEKPLVKTFYTWGSGDEVSIRIGLTPKGEWRLWYKPKASQKSYYGGTATSFCNTYMGWSGIVFNYTATRSGQLWLDDLSICSLDYPPVLLSAKPLNLNSVEVLFSEQVNQTDASNESNYTIIDSNGTPIPLTSVMLSVVEASALPGVILKTNKLPFGRLLLKVSNIRGLNGSSSNDSIYFGLGEQGAFGLLVINEIMPNPLPSKGLPEFEYIELYNPTNDTISLNGWRLVLNNYPLSLPADTILPKKYAVLCSTSAEQALSSYGKAIGVTSFPALLNSGMSLKLFDSEDEIISLVSYIDSWFVDDSKKEGGWSLEKIDYQNLMEGKNNWRASNSLIGGTPCAVNSIAAVNPDITPPRLLSIEVVNDSSIILSLSEPMDSLMLTYTSNYAIDNGVGHPNSAKLIGDGYSEVLLSLDRPISSEIIYNLCLSADIIDFSGNHLAEEFVKYSLPQIPEWNDIVINEILFNPNVGGVDFVELYNRSSKTFDLKKLSLSNRNGANQLDQVYSISDTSKLIFPQGYAVVTTNPMLVKMFYQTKNDKAFAVATDMASFNNDKGHVVLLNNDSIIIDEVSYSENMHSKLLNDFKGVSLERISPEFASSSSSTWHSASQLVGYATPTYKNSQWVEPSQTDDAFTLSPETFSPDGDGHDDYLLISYRLPIEGTVANIRIFDSKGREVKRLASNLMVGTQGNITWDGLNGRDQRVPIGIYVIYIEYFNPKGEVKKLKKTCVVAEKL